MFCNTHKDHIFVVLIFMIKMIKHITISLEELFYDLFRATKFEALTLEAEKKMVLSVVRNK